MSRLTVRIDPKDPKKGVIVPGTPKKKVPKKEIKIFVSFKATVEFDEISNNISAVVSSLKLTSINRHIKIINPIMWDCKPDKD
jgi:hypothetical protein